MPKVRNDHIHQLGASGFRVPILIDKRLSILQASSKQTKLDGQDHDNIAIFNGISLCCDD